MVKLPEYSVLVIHYFRYVGPGSSVLQCGLHIFWTYDLESDDELFKSLKINVLSVDELPCNVMLEGYALIATMLGRIINIIDDIDFLERSYRKVSDTGNGLIFFINGYIFSLI